MLHHNVYGTLGSHESMAMVGLRLARRLLLSSGVAQAGGGWGRLLVINGGGATGKCKAPQGII